VRVFTIEAFDDLISGTTGVWYTPARFNNQLGSVDGLVLHAVTTNVSGTASLNCAVYHSGNGTDWLAFAATPAINGQTISDDKVCEGQHGIISHFLHYVRVRIWLTGTSPKCRLKLHVAGFVAGQNGPSRASGPQERRAPMPGGENRRMVR
jgi:hypothetical protein